MSIITIQAGNFANYCGSHFWNLEDEVYRTYGDECPIEAEVCYEELPSGIWAPRLVCLDKTGAAGHIRQDEMIEDMIEEHENANNLGHTLNGTKWVTNTHTGEKMERLNVFDGEPTQRHPFQEAVRSQEAVEPRSEFRENVRYWSDFLKVDVSSSVHEISGIHQSLPFTYFAGRSEVSRDEREVIEDCVRRQVERSDLLQAFHVLVDSTDAFASITEDLLCWAREEQPKSGLLVAALSEHAKDCDEPRANECTVNDEVNRRVAQGMFLHAAVNAGTNLIVPIDTPSWSREMPHYLSCPADTRYEASAFIGLALHNVTFPYRLKLSPIGASSFMNNFPSRLCGLRMQAPLTAESVIESYYDLTATSFDPFSHEHFVTVRGVPEIPRFHTHARWCTHDKLPIPMPIPFPQKFDTNILRDGQRGTGDPRQGDVETLPLATMLHATSQGGCETIVNIQASMERFRNKGRVQAASIYGLDDEEFMEAKETLRWLY